MSPQDDVARGHIQTYVGEHEFEPPFLQTFATAYEGYAAEEHTAVTRPDEGYVPFAVAQEASDGYGKANEPSTHSGE